MGVIEIFYVISFTAILLAAFSGFSFSMWVDFGASKKSYWFKKLGFLSLVFYSIAFISLLILYAVSVPNFQLGFFWKTGILVLATILFIATGVIWWRVVRGFLEKPKKPTKRAFPPFILLCWLFLTLLGTDFWINLFFGTGN